MAVIVSKPNLAALNAFAMTKSELIERITTRQAQLSAKDVELAVKTMIEHMAQTLAQGHRIEIRGFGSFLSTIGPRVSAAIPRPANRLVCPANTCRTSSLARNCAIASTRA